MSKIIHAPPKARRGKARPTAQLSELQRSILHWILKERRLMSRTSNDRDEYDRSGVKWNAKSFYRTLTNEFNLTCTKVVLSKSLMRLEERSLVTRLKENSRTNKVKLTSLGENLAMQQEDNLMEERTPEQATADLQEIHRMVYRKLLVMEKNEIHRFFVLTTALKSLSDAKLEKYLVSHDGKGTFKKIRVNPAIIKAFQDFQDFQIPFNSEDEFLEFMWQTTLSWQTRLS